MAAAPLMIAVRPACTLVRLSIRPAANSSPAIPIRAGAAVSATRTSWPTTSSAMHAGGSGQVGQDAVIAGDRGPVVVQPEDGMQVVLRIEGEAVGVDASVEVHRELGEAEQRTGADEVTAAVAGDQTPGELQVTVEPGVEQGTAVDLDTGLAPAVATGVRIGLELERR